MIELTPAASSILRMLERAADNGEACPNNNVLAGAIGADSTSTPVRIMAGLEKRGLISVERGSIARVVTILSTGKKTAGTAGKQHWRFRPENKARRHVRYPGTPKPKAVPVEAQTFARVDRDPCPRCGVRGDYGCRHQSATVALEGAA